MYKKRQTNLLTIIIITTLMLIACNFTAFQSVSNKIRGSGKIVTQEETITGFDRLEIDMGFQVDLHQGDTFSVVIRVDDNILEHVRVVKEGNTLKISLDPDRSYNMLNATLEADVTMPELNGADMSGGSHLQGDFEANDLTLKLSGGCHITLSGSAVNLTVDANGGSQAKLGNLAVLNAVVDAGGGSHVTVNPSGRLDAVARGGSHISYLGNPTLGTIDDDVSSSIKQE